MKESSAERSRRRLLVDEARSAERQLLRAHLRAEIIPGLESLIDPGANRMELIARAGAQARRLRAELEQYEQSGEPLDLEPAARHARESERQWVRGHLHDSALQILEFIAGDGLGTKLSAAKIAHLAYGASEDLRSWLDDEQPAHAELTHEIERIVADARSLDPTVELVVTEVGSPLLGEQVSAIAGALREALTNARKHAKASQVVVRLMTDADGRTLVTVTDDGVGLRPTTGSGLGIRRSIVGRMRRAGGDAWIQDAPGGGTLVALSTARPGRRPR